MLLCVPIVIKYEKKRHRTYSDRYYRDVIFFLPKHSVRKKTRENVPPRASDEGLGSAFNWAFVDVGSRARARTATAPKTTRPKTVWPPRANRWLAIWRTRRTTRTATTSYSNPNRRPNRNRNPNRRRRHRKVSEERRIKITPSRIFTDRFSFFRALGVPQGHRVLEQPAERRRLGGQTHDRRHRHTAAAAQLGGQRHHQKTEIVGRRSVRTFLNAPRFHPSRVLGFNGGCKYRNFTPEKNTTLGAFYSSRSNVPRVNTSRWIVRWHKLHTNYKPSLSLDIG